MAGHAFTCIDFDPVIELYISPKGVGPGRNVGLWNDNFGCVDSSELCNVCVGLKFVQGEVDELPVGMVVQRLLELGRQMGKCVKW